ncbi:hypothetical protein NECAME_03975 [Necator americanus]|uniref:Uncharacterized protein n=1 Tax=Necator americanus TaxID=51031 RepID=W2T075_NECAM|nr:hypothetical protein NECAME_03975 [Necator americanus]ETN74661.1 hypothetical protein NECAME_03975 [Necator americanus]
MTGSFLCRKTKKCVKSLSRVVIYRIKVTSQWLFFSEKSRYNEGVSIQRRREKSYVTFVVCVKIRKYGYLPILGVMFFL